MEQQNKLFIQDICARLPYRPQCLVHTNHGKDIVMTLMGIYTYTPYHLGYFIDDDGNPKHSDHFKPFLLPFEELSEEQHEEYLNTCNCYCEYYQTEETFDWLYKNHIDFRGLIEKDLALNICELSKYR